MNSEQVQDAAGALYGAARSGNFIPPLSETYTGISLDDAYAVQLVNTKRRISEGRRVVGCKIGLTSHAVQKQLGVNQPDFGMLFDDMGYGDGELIPSTILTQPCIEAEIAFVLGKDLTIVNPGHLDVLNAIEYALPALEIVGSRIADWNIRIADTIADNASASAFVLGSSPKRPADFDMRMCGMVIEHRGEPASTGIGLACLGNPLNAVVWLARRMAALGTPMKAGDLILSGALGPMVGVTPGNVYEARINGLGAVRAVFDGPGQGSNDGR